VVEVPPSSLPPGEPGGGFSANSCPEKKRGWIFFPKEKKKRGVLLKMNLKREKTPLEGEKKKEKRKKGGGVLQTS